MKTLNQIIGQNLQFLRVKFGYSQEAISNMLEISQPAYHKYETGETTVSQDALEKLATLYYVEEYDLMQENQDNLIPALAFAFRGDADLAAISDFHRIIKNYILMKDELNKTQRVKA